MSVPENIQVLIEAVGKTNSMYVTVRRDTLSEVLGVLASQQKGEDVREEEDSDVS